MEYVSETNFISHHIPRATKIDVEKFSHLYIESTNVSHTHRAMVAGETADGTLHG